MLKPTISIDLGASYTKVAFRNVLERPRGKYFAQADSYIAVIEAGAVMTPSLMVQTHSARHPWIAGQKAYNMIPADNMGVYSNWKQTFFSAEFEKKKVEVAIVAGNFFAWLLTRVRSLGEIDLDSCRVRVSVPAFKGIDKQKAAIAKCMTLNGWPEDVEVVDEPVSNLLGILSSGRNVVSATGEISYWPTFGGSCVFEKMRQHALDRSSKPEMQVSVLDFGSFTLDAATVRLDLNPIDYKNFPVKNVKAASWKVGVMEDIDRPCFSQLFARHGVDEAEITQYEKEAAKVKLYAGEPRALMRGRVILGVSDADRKTVASSIDEYCRKVWSQAGDYCSGSEVVVLTGGGACIDSVRESIHDQLKAAGVRNVLDFARGEGCDLDCGLYDWTDSGEGLGRVATALGGSSIGHGFDPDEQCKRHILTHGRNL